MTPTEWFAGRGRGRYSAEEIEAMIEQRNAARAGEGLRDGRRASATSLPKAGVTIEDGAGRHDLATGMR